jgi:hypothetical protein
MGLYADIAAGTIDARIIAYEPAFALWSDGADKRRFLSLPANQKIDTSDMDHWQFPVGTRLFKEFSLNGQLLETRMIERTDSRGRSSDYSLSSFVWRQDQCDAVETTTGAIGVLGTTHDVPSSADCTSCHDGEPGQVLGFSAIQLSGSGRPLTLASLATSGLLTSPPPPGADYHVSGDPTTVAALGYLHANCGHCHNAGTRLGERLAMDLRLVVADRTPEATAIWRSTVNQPTQWFRAAGITARIAAHDPNASAIPYRMAHRGMYPQMPPLATKVIDSAGVALLRSWISTIP